MDCSAQTYQKYVPFWKMSKADIPGEFDCRFDAKMSINDRMYCFRHGGLVLHDALINNDARLYRDNEITLNIPVRYKQIADINMFRNDFQKNPSKRSTCGAILTEAAKINRRNMPCGNRVTVFYGDKKMCKLHAVQAMLDDVLWGKVRVIGAKGEIVIKRKVIQMVDTLVDIG